MEFADDGGAMVYAPDGTEIAMVEACDITYKFKCIVIGDYVLPESLKDDMMAQTLYIAKIENRKGGYAPILKEMIIAASLHRGYFTDNVLWAKQNEEDAVERQKQARTYERKGQSPTKTVLIPEPKFAEGSVTSRTITLRVKNDSNRKQSVVLFNVTKTFTMVNFGLPSDVSVLGIYGPGETTSYVSFLAEIMASSKSASILSSTNNRKLSFFTHDWSWPGKERVEPTLTKKGKHRPRKKDRQYLMEWSPKKWNIADTHERFVLDSGFECRLSLGAYQEFNLELKLGL